MHCKPHGHGAEEYQANRIVKKPSMLMSLFQHLECCKEGPSIWYLNRLRNDTKNTVLFTGYQASGTGGRKLQTEGKVDIFGNETQIPLEWESYSFSTHAGQKEILEFATACEAEEVVIYHTDPNTARPPLVEELKKNGHVVHTPVNGISEYLGEEFGRSN